MSETDIFEYSCSDDIEIVKLMWKIRNFGNREGINISPLFVTSAPGIFGNWRIQLNYYSSRYISVHILQENSAVQSTGMVFYLLSEQHSLAQRGVSQCRESNPYYSFECDKKRNLVSINAFLSCEIVFKVPSEKSLANFEAPPCQLVEDLGNLLSSMTLSDVTITVGGAELKAHKAVLAARSAVFAAMFTNQMREKETSVVEVADMDAEVFQAMLEFVYTGKLISQTCGALDLLYAAATKYQLEGLKDLCEEALCEALSVDNVLENLALADLHNAPRLQEQCISFVMQHRPEILRTSSWDSFIRSHPSLVTEIIAAIGH